PLEQWPLDMKEHEELVSEMVRSILATRWETDPHARVDPQVLAGLIEEEFNVHGLPRNYSYGIFDQQGKAILIPVDSRGDEEALRSSPYRERLFRYDLVGTEFHLHVLIPDQHRILLGSMLPMIVISAIFLVIVSIAFFHTMRTIMRQKRLNDIRNDLVNNLTHELETPISTISLACEALNDPSVPQNEDSRRRFVTMIRDENKRLGSLVENV